jgi:hypothetical protein
MSSSLRFSNLRGQDEGYHAGNFSKRWKEQHNHRNGVERQHPIYQAFEAAGEDYPIPPHMTPEYSYSILEHLVEQVNKKTQKTGKRTEIVVDKTFERYIQRDENGIYHLTPFAKMSVSESEIRPRTLRSRVKSFVRPALALAASLAIAVGSLMYIRNQNSQETAFREWGQQYIEKMVNDYPLSNGLLVQYVAGDKPIRDLSSQEMERIMSLVITTDAKDMHSILKNPVRRADYEGYCRFRVSHS